MKLLFDQNVSPKLCRLLADVFPNAAHVREIGLREADDATIWRRAQSENRVIVTKDSDFRQRSFLEGFPPKIILIQLGNCSTRAIETLLRRRAAEINS